MISITDKKTKLSRVFENLIAQGKEKDREVDISRERINGIIDVILESVGSIDDEDFFELLDNMSKTTNTLLIHGLTASSIVDIIEARPEIFIRTNNQRVVAIMIMLRNRGLDEKRIETFITRNPYILMMDSEALEQRLSILSDLRGSSSKKL